MIGPGFALGCVLLVALGCAKKQEAPRRTEPWLASASASSAPVPFAASAFDLRFVSESKIAFGLSGRKGKLRGEVPLAQGKLRLDLANLARSTASIDVDLTRITVAIDSMTPGALPADAGPPESLAPLALQWLELGPDVATERRSQFALARFELTSLENLSAQVFDVHAKGATVRATAVGTLLLHGFRAPVRVDVLLLALPSTTSSHFRVSIRSSSPLVLPLAPHDIVARGPSGTPEPLQTARAEGLVGKNARIEFELVAEDLTR